MGRPKVLFVDDEPNVTSAMKRHLRKEPYDIICANAGGEALDILACQLIDVVVSDEKMPRMTGTEFLARVYEEYPDIMRIMLTGHATLDTAIRGINEGHLWRFLTKPCNGDELAATIRQALQHKAMLSESRRLLEITRHQTRLLEDLERQTPGITDIELDLDGSIILEDVDDIESLTRSIQEEVRRCEQLFKVQL